MKQNSIQKNFDSKFNKFKKKSIGIYGTGKSARAIIENVEGYNFTCLISTEFLYEKVYGLTVVPLNEAIKIVDLIIIAAIPSSTAIVFNRIKDSVPDIIMIYNLQGFLLRGDDNYKNNLYWNETCESLRKQIDNHDVISFDIFDTLITRTVLQPRDIFEIMIKEDNFKDCRIKSEEELYSLYASPTLTQIYERVSLNNGWDDKRKQYAQYREVQTEKNNIVLRKKIMELFEYAVGIGKRVYLTSDMYLEEADVKMLLSSVGIYSGYKLLLSSQYGKTKENGELFDVLLDSNPSTGIIHIGDNQVTDINNALQKGIDVFYIKSGYDLLAESSCAFLFDLMKTQWDRRLLGYAVSILLNNPFCLGKTKGKININSYEKIAVCIFPMTVLFLYNIIEWATEYDELLFASRDGFFLYEIYEWYRKTYSSNLPEGKYIYVSRSAISRMAVKTENDIEIFLNKIVDDPKLNLKKLVENQFQISLTEEFDVSTGEAVDRWGIDEIRSKISIYYNQILENAAETRKRYISFLEKSQIKTKGKIAVIDIVTQGTLVYGLNNIFENDIDLFALGTSAVPNKYVRDVSAVHSVYGNITERIGDCLCSVSDFSELHLFNEMLYASGEGQFDSVDAELNPVFVSESEYNSELLKNVQRFLWIMAEKFIVDGVVPEVSSEFALGMLRVFSKKFGVFSDEIKEKFSFEDLYDGSIQKCNLIDYIQ